MELLIVSNSKDPHTHAVSWGLRQLGVSSVLWDWSAFPSCDGAILELSPGKQVQLTFAPDGAVQAGKFDTIWYRRPGKPTAPPNSHPDDREFIETEARRFLEYALPFAAHAHTRWVNEPTIESAANNKMRQLALANELGFRVPATRMGNVVDDIRTFMGQQGGKLAHKAFSPMSWANDDGSRTTARTAMIGRQHLASATAVSSCPSIYQELIPKKHELRVTVIGQRVLAAAIHSQQFGPTTDWRCEGGRGRTNLTATTLDAKLTECCLKLCAALGLNFGCIDLIVTPDDEVVFLEINTAGQFLFNEIADPSIPMLDAFCRYLAMLPDDAGPRLSMAAFHASADGNAVLAAFQRDRIDAAAATLRKRTG